MRWLSGREVASHAGQFRISGFDLQWGENKSLKQVVTANPTDKRSATDVGVTCPLR